MIKKIIKSAFRALGFTITKIQKDQPRPIDPDDKIGINPKYLAKVCKPELVIDVGVAYGTYPIYDAFPKARLILVEPLKEYKKAIEKILDEFGGSWVPKALGEEPGELEIKFTGETFEKASLFERTELSAEEGRDKSRKVEVTTLDQVLENENIANQKVLLKIDTEGGELSVLKGARSSLQHIDYVIAEVSIANRFEGSYVFEDMIRFMDQQGFYLYSILSMTGPPTETRQRFLDILFLRR